MCVICLRERRVSDDSRGQIMKNMLLIFNIFKDLFYFIVFFFITNINQHFNPFHKMIKTKHHIYNLYIQLRILLIRFLLTWAHLLSARRDRHKIATIYALESLSSLSYGAPIEN